MEAEETAQLLELFVEGIPCSSSVAATPMSVAPDFLNRYWSATDPKRHGEKLALIREMVDVLPEWEVIHVLFEVFVTRCQGPLGNVVHTPTFMAQAALFGNCLNLASADERASAIASAITMETLGCYLLAVGGVYLTQKPHAHIIVCLSACARSCFSSYALDIGMESYAVGLARGRVTIVPFAREDMEDSRLALSPGRSVSLLWLNRWVTGCSHAPTRQPRGLIGAGRGSGHCDLRSSQTWSTPAEGY